MPPATFKQQAISFRTLLCFSAVGYNGTAELESISRIWLLPVVLKPNSKGQETAKARTHTVAIMAKTLFLDRWVVLYKTGITTAVYLGTKTYAGEKV